MSIYQPGIPTGTVNLDVDYQNIQNNFTQLDTSFGVDHVTFSNQTAQNGYHRSIHFNPVSTSATNPPNNNPIIAPAYVAGYGQLFSASFNDGINDDTALFFLTGGNRQSLLTRNFSPLPAVPGYTYLPGGMIMQWGATNSTSGGAGSPNLTIPSFPLGAFPVNVFSIQLLVLEASNSRRLWHLNSVSNSGFTAYVTDIDGVNVANPVYWTVLGF